MHNVVRWTSLAFAGVFATPRLGETSSHLALLCAGASLAFLVATISAPAADGPSSYICIEERSVGWEPKDSEPEVVGIFNPSEVPKIVTFYPPSFRQDIVEILPKIEVTQEGKTATFTSNACSDAVAEMISDRQFKVSGEIDVYLKSCAISLRNRPMGMEGFGVGNHRWAFTGDPSKRENPIRYTEALIVGVAWAYVSRGTCTFAR